MIANDSSSQHLSRRLLAHYMMFGLLSITALVLSLVFIVNWSTKTAGDQGILSRLSVAADQITADYKSDDGTSVQSIVDDLGKSPDCLFASVVSNEGIYLAHSNRELVECKAARNFSAAKASGVIERITYLRADNAGPREYWLPLRREETYGMLQVGILGNETRTWTSTLTRHAGTAAALPIILLMLGGLKLNGVVKSSSAIERQLAQLASEDSEEVAKIQPVEVLGPASIGWNRLAQQTAKHQLINSLESRLSDALGGFHQEKHESILQGLTDGVASTSEDGTITFSNKAFAVLLNTDAQTIIGSSVEQLILSNLPGNEPKFNQQMQELSRPGVAELHRSENLSDGVLRLARYPLRSKDGKSVTQVWSLRDITQQKLVEFTRDQFVDTATHELRTPLTTIKVCAETLELEDDIDVETHKKYLNTINMEATRLGRFVDEFLNISRMEAGSLAVNRNNVHFDRLLADVIEKVRPQMDVKQLEFNVLLPPKLPELSLDKEKIAGALVNLLGNAAKYTPESGRVTLQVEVSESNILIHVEDTGFGITADEMSKVFDKFFRSEDDRVRDVTGTGLGLAFSQEVARLHGGEISVQSEIDHGSRFTFSLPLA